MADQAVAISAALATQNAWQICGGLRGQKLATNTTLAFLFSHFFFFHCGKIKPHKPMNGKTWQELCKNYGSVRLIEHFEYWPEDEHHFPIPLSFLALPFSHTKEVSITNTATANAPNGTSKKKKKRKTEKQRGNTRKS